MRLSADQALERFTAHDHGVLATVHPDRGVHAVPCVYAVDADGFLGVPIDTVKPKTSTQLQRERNLEVDPRATLLADLWDHDDWTRLWWVRVDLSQVLEPEPSRIASLGALLADKHVQYAGQPFATVLVFSITGVTGWSAA